ncbi:glycosyltransferase family 2 protein [Pseudalkalibacillus hwajinpoensis]|uniref:glycosyltransferase family 2 protein n=1 Tax=Guptibacillus hwajinpoensis TaxID=208199 RepID=UPI00325B081F
MNLFKKIFYKFPLATRLYFREHLGYKAPFKLFLLNKKLNREYKNYKFNKDSGLEVKDGIEKWYQSFKKFLSAQPNESEVAFEFFKNNISLLKSSDLETNKKEVTLLCVVKNDLLKIRKLVEHHRKIGIKHFAILDNGSTDGTIDWLKVQEDVDLFCVEDKYTTNRREAWINRLIAYYGLNRWYLIVDSDELFAYHNMENEKISSLINHCENNSVNRMRAVMIDMYANDQFYLSSDDKADYIDSCRYFDLNSYKYENRDFIDLVTGGPRGRIFKQNPWLTKYPLCYFEEGDIQGKSHFLFPFSKNKNTKCSVVLLHYKFLPNDIEKYRQISLDGNYFNGSVQYKEYVDYIDNSTNLSFINEETQEFNGTDSLYKIPILEKINL